MRNACLTCLMVAALAAAFVPARAMTLHEDVSYWYEDGDQILTTFNPSTDWLAENIPTGRVLVRVLQTVYDPVSTFSILKRNGDGQDHPGYLYSYTVTNLDVGDPDDLTDMGITEFVVSWDIAPAYVTIARHAPLGWAVDNESSEEPAWKWTGTGEGILPGDTVGGFWAVASTGADRVVDASTVHTGGANPRTVTGKTTGPTPEAPTVLSLAAGIVGLGVLRRTRRRQAGV
jgi:hypothetical protein